MNDEVSLKGSNIGNNNSKVGMVKNNKHTNISSNEPLTDIQHK
jgi:hypothetical protein